MTLARTQIQTYRHRYRVNHLQQSTVWYNTNPKGVVLQLSYICQFRDCRRGPPRSHGGTLCPWTFLGESGYVCKIWSWSVQSFCSFPTFVNFGISVGGPQCHVGESYYAHELLPRIWNPSLKKLGFHIRGKRTGICEYDVRVGCFLSLRHKTMPTSKISTGKQNRSLS